MYFSGGVPSEERRLLTEVSKTVASKPVGFEDIL